jgi:EAL and modified HD-GYP domain-containing signal transduction protein
LVRQPILDLHGRDHAFKLSMNSPRATADEDAQTGNAMIGSAAYFKLEKPHELKKLTGGLLAFVHRDRGPAPEVLAQHFSQTLTILEVSASNGSTPELVADCEQLRAMGFRLAIEDFAWNSEEEVLLSLADYVKVDISQSNKEARRDLIAHLRGKPITAIATNVDTPTDYRQARDEGFNFFEGFYFCEPISTKNRRPPANQLLRIQILQAVQKRPMDLPKLSELVKRDGPLAYQLLRLVNSPLYALRQQIESIQDALLAVGEDAFRRIALLPIATEFNGDQPPELLCMAMIRGRFCEAAGCIRNLDSFGQYLLGLLSLLPAMQGQPMVELAPALPLNSEIREALLGTTNPDRVLLEWLEHYERADWPACEAIAETHNLNQQNLVHLYIEAVAWAEAALRS